MNQKNKKSIKPAPKPTTPGFNQKHPVWTFVLITLLLLVIFYSPILFQGKTLVSPDKMTSMAMKEFVRHNPSGNHFPLWCPYVFSGMPSYASLMSVPIVVNLVDAPVRTLLELVNIFPDPNFIFVFLNYLLFGLLTFLLMRELKVGYLASAFAGLVIILMPQYHAFTSYGHNTKFLSLMLIPLILILVKRLFEKRNLLYFALTSLTLGLQLIRAHVQVCYYTYLLLGIYLLFTVITNYRSSKKISDILVPAGLLAGVIVAGALLSSVVYVSVFDYQHYSIRGSSEGTGLNFDYASSWSFHPLEMVTFIIPSFMGFGGATYWGKMPFTDYPLYFGVLIMLFAGIALVLKRDRNTWFYSIIALFSLLVSFGKHFPLLYAPMFKLLPFFNKFRIPSMIHILLDFAMVVLAAYGLQALFDLAQSIKDGGKEQKKIKALQNYVYIFGGVVVLFALFMLFAQGAFMDLVAKSRSNITVGLRSQAYSMALTDSLKALAFTGIAILLILQLIRKKLSPLYAGMTIILLVIVDLWVVDAKIVTPQPRVTEKAFFAKTPAVDYMLKDKSLYRIYPVMDDKSANWYMYYMIGNIKGYSAAKIRIYQDFLEETGYNDNNSPFFSKYWRNVMRNNRQSYEPVPVNEINPQRLNFDYAMLDMMNVKYLLSMGMPINDPRYRLATYYPVQYQGQRLNYMVYENTSVLPRAFFADSIQVLTGRSRIFDRMRTADFDPRKLAIIEQDPPFSVFAADSNSVNVTDFKVHSIKLKASAKKNALLVLSEVYYPAGWKAYDNGVETKIFKTNYLLRSIFLEPGEHEIEFRFEPASFKLGLWISLATLALLLLVLAGYGLRYYRQNKA